MSIVPVSLLTGNEVEKHYMQNNNNHSNTTQEAIEAAIHNLQVLISETVNLGVPPALISHIMSEVFSEMNLEEQGFNESVHVAYFNQSAWGA